MKTVFLLLISTFILGACSTTQEIKLMQTGEHRYEITKYEAYYPGPNILQREVTREARKFCRSLDKKLHIIAAFETKPPFTGSKRPFAEIKFECSPKAH